MDIYSIYKATNLINGKSYIGYTSDFKTRQKGHLKQSATKDNKFYRAIRKYGWNNFQWEIIYQSQDKKYTHNVMEPHFIKEYDSIKNGYNSTTGGEGGDTFTNNVNKNLIREKLSKASIISNSKPENIILHTEIMKRVNANKTEETKRLSIQKMTETKRSKEWKETNPITDNHRQNLSISQKKRYSNKEERQKASDNAKNIWGNNNIRKIMPVNNTVCCVVCHQEIQIPNFHRWHKNKCNITQ